MNQTAAINELSALYPASDGHEIVILTTHAVYPCTQRLVENYYINIRKGDEVLKTSAGPNLQCAVDLITEKPTAEDRASLELAAKASGAEPDGVRYFNLATSVWRCTEEKCEIWDKSDPVFTSSVLKAGDFEEEREITRAEALKLTGGAL